MQPLWGGPDDHAPTVREAGRVRVLVTVKAAPNPSGAYGETVCVAGLRLDSDREGWIRLYPINFRSLSEHQTFAKYSVITIDVSPARSDTRPESYTPDLSSLHIENASPPAWGPRTRLLDPWITGDLCTLIQRTTADPAAPSLGLISPFEVQGLDFEEHPGWTVDEQAKIDRYVDQLSLFGDEDRTPLEAPTYKGWYRFTCHSQDCRGHRLRLLDWEFVVLQRRLRGRSDADQREQLRNRFLGQLCDVRCATAFYVGNLHARRHVWQVLGVYYPPRGR